MRPPRTPGRRDAAASSPQTPKGFNFCPGDPVEVVLDEAGLRGAHFAAVVVGPSAKPRGGYTVEYDSLLESEDSDRRLRESLPARSLRPRPPPPPASGAPLPAEHAAVDALIDDAWWLGVALGRPGAAPGNVRVCFPETREIMEFYAADVRPHLEWVAGEWRSPDSMEIPKTIPYANGMQVEVSKLEDNSVVAWSPAVVAKTIWKNNLLVDYTASKCYGTALSEEIIDVKHARPCPPQASEINFCINDEVEAFQGDRWWLGVITNVHPEFKYTFKSAHLGTEVEVDQKSLRLRYDWVDDQWEQVSKNLAKLKYTQGVKVEVCSDDEGFRGAWFEATIVKPVGNKFFVEYASLKDDDETKPLKETVEARHIRPCPPDIPVTDGFKLLDEVDAFCNDGWWVGVVSKVLGEKKCMVYFRPWKDENEFEHAQLRLHCDWMGGRWMRASPIRGGGNEISVGMIGSAPDLARRKLSHGGANDEVREVKNTKTSADAFRDKRKKKEYLCNSSHVKDRDIWNGDQMIKKSRVPGALSEKGREKDDLNKTNSKKKMMSVVDPDKKKNDYSKVESKKKANTTSPEEEWKKKLPNASTWRNMQRDDGEVNSKKVSTTLSEKEKNKEKLNKTHREKKMQADDSKMLLNEIRAIACSRKKDSKMRNYNSGVKKMKAAHSKMRNYGSGVIKGKVSSTHCDKEKKRKRPDATNSEETASITSAVKEKKMRTIENMETRMRHKEKNMRTTESMEIKMRHDRQNRRNVPLDVSNKKMHTSSDSNYKTGKRTLAHTQLKKKKRTQCNDSDKKIHGAKVKEMKIFSCGKEKVNRASFAFFKVMLNNFEKFLVIPLTVAPRLEYLTNRLVFLKDSDGKYSVVMVSKVAGSLAFNQGWDIFVSNHLIKWGEFLLFEYIDESTFSVRVFGTDSSERLYFNAESTTKGDRKKQTWSNMSPDDLVFNDGTSENIDNGNYVFGENPRTKVPQTGHVTSNIKEDPKQDKHVAQDNNDNLIDSQCKTKGTSPLCSKGKMVIEIVDSEDSEPSAHENGDTVKPATSGADSDTCLVAVNNNEDPIRAQSGTGNGPSVVLADKKGSSPEIESGTKSISTTCSEGKTRSEIIINSTALLDLHDSDEDLGRKQRTNAIPSDSITPVEDYHNHSKMNIIQKVCRKYEAPGGFRCLEKWRKDAVNNQVALDCTVPIKSENPQKNDSMSVDVYGSIELNPVDKYICSEGNHEYVQPIFTMSIKEPPSADRVTNCGHDGTDVDYCINEKDEGASVLLEVKGEQLEHTGSIVHSQSTNVPLCADPVVLDKYGALGLTPIGSEGSCAFIESMFTGPIEKTSSPDEISKCRSSMIEIEHNVNGKGTTVQFETKMDQVEPVRSSVGSENCNIVVRANESEYRSSKQEVKMSSNCEVPESLLPMKEEILELDHHSPTEVTLQLCIPDTTKKWLGLSKSLSSAVKLSQRRHGWNVVMLKDPMKRLWPIIYHDSPTFMGFTAGWKPFVGANNLQTGDVCELIKESSDDDEPVYSVRKCGKM